MANPRQIALRERQDQLRKQLFSDVPESEIWDRRVNTGFATVPRALPLIMVILDSLSPNKPISSVYCALWCRGWDGPLVQVGRNQAEIAMESGYSGQRAASTLTSRLAVLEKLGVVRFAPGASGPFSHALLLNPYRVIRRHQGNITPELWNALVTRLSDIGATDMDTTPPPPSPAPVASAFTAVNTSGKQSKRTQKK